ncbi:hypothetical protein [Tenebrionicola larvae]
MAWLLCLVMLSSAVACTGEKSASGQKVSGVKTHQQNSTPSPGKHREKAVAVRDGAPDKVVVENNLLGGSEDAQAAWIRQHGVDMATCSDNPDGAACQKAMNERDAVGLALATGSVALLPGSAQAMWGLGAGANAGISYLADGAIDPANAAIAGWVNVINMGNGLAGTIGWNAAGGALGNWLDDKDPLSGAISNGIGSAAGYGIGKGITWGTDKITNAVGKWVTNGWNPKYDSTWIKYAEVNRNDIIREGMKPSNVPGTAGDIGGSIGSELNSCAEYCYTFASPCLPPGNGLAVSIKWRTFFNSCHIERH